MSLRESASDSSPGAGSQPEKQQPHQHTLQQATQHQQQKKARCC
jgi:hypothetical protein